MTDFAEWLNDELQKRGWNQAELARKADVSRAAISDILSGKYQVGFDVCLAIAQAFVLPPENVLRAAGLLPKVDPAVEAKAEIVGLFDQLTPNQQKLLTEFARFLKERSTERNRQRERHMDTWDKVRKICKRIDEDYDPENNLGQPVVTNIDMELKDAALLLADYCESLDERIRQLETNAAIRRQSELDYAQTLTVLESQPIESSPKDDFQEEIQENGTVDFPEWLNAVLQHRNWKQSELARRAGLSRTAISDIISGKHQVGFQACSGIARAFGMPVMEVFRAAGLVPPLPIEDPITNEFRELFTGLSPDKKKKTLRFMRYLAQSLTDENG